MLTLVHTADQQLGANQYGLPVRDDDYRQAFQHVLRHAGMAGDVNAVILAGDLFETPNPSATDVRTTLDGIQAMQAESIPVYAIDGNHDATANQWLYVCGMHPLDPNPGSMPPVQTVTNGGVTTTIAGLNNIPTAQVAARIKELAAEGLKCEVLVLHQLFGEICGFPDVGLTCAEIIPDLKTMGVKLVLLGDVHDHAYMVLEGIAFTYCGSPERTAIDENPNKVFNIIRYDGEAFRVETVPIPTRPLLQIQVRTTDDVNNIQDLLASAVAENASADERKPVAMIYYDPGLPEARSRLTRQLAGLAHVRLLTLKSDESPERVAAMLDMLQRAAEHTQGSHGVEVNLTTELTAQRAELPEPVANLISACLMDPSKTTEIANQYMTEGTV